MSARRVMGIETEYGISLPGQPGANAMLLCSQVGNAYAADARGFDLDRAGADPSQLTDEDLGLANVILTNGARLYVDHAHPEYSSPEVTGPRDAVLWDKAGELIMARGAQLAAQTPQAAGTPPITLYKN